MAKCDYYDFFQRLTSVLRTWLESAGEMIIVYILKQRLVILTIFFHEFIKKTQVRKTDYIIKYLSYKEKYQTDYI